MMTSKTEQWESLVVDKINNELFVYLECDGHRVPLGKMDLNDKRCVSWKFKDLPVPTKSPASITVMDLQSHNQKEEDHYEPSKK